MKKIAIDTETTSADPHAASILGVSVYSKDQHEYFNGVPDIDLKDSFVITQNGKYDAVVLARHGFPRFRISFDTMLAQYLIAIEKPRKLELMVKQYLGREKEDLIQVYNKAAGKDRKHLPENWYEQVPQQDLIKYALDDVKSTYELYEILDSKLTGSLREWYYEVEIPLLNILVEMELTGVEVDIKELKKMESELSISVVDLELKIKELVGNEDLNIDSPKQLREVLYERLKLPVYKKTDSGEASTDIQVLTKLAEKNAFAKVLVEYRECNKMLSTYVRPIIEKTDRNSRLHTQYNQALTRTRRFSSENPNLQNIPARTELGKTIKRCFRAKKGHVLCVADYSQMELRILAHASGDKVLIDAFHNNQDIHQITASSLGLDRRKAKIVNFAIVYGTTQYGLGDQLNSSIEDAEKYISKFLDTYPGIRNYMAKQIATLVKTNGFVYSCPAGLPIYCGDVRSADKWQKARIERQAINSPIQAGSQDIAKKAWVNIYDSLSVVPVLFVHDEFVFELPEESAEETSLLIVKEMEEAFKLDVPLVVEYKLTERWEK